MTQNITVKLEERVAEKAAAIASAQQRRLPDWVAGLVNEAVAKPDDFEHAKRQALAHLERGLSLGGRPLSREDIYDRGPNIR